MTDIISMEEKFVISQDVVSREIEGELIIIPLVSGIGNLEDDLFTLNDTGKEIWKNLDGEKTLQEISDILMKNFTSEPEIIDADIKGLVSELYQRKIVVKK